MVVGPVRSLVAMSTGSHIHRAKGLLCGSRRRTASGADIPAAPRPVIGAEPGRVGGPGAVPPTVVEPPPEPKAPPVRGGPPGGLTLGGGVLPDGTLPHLVEPPGANSPDLPVIGDGIPDEPEA